MNAPDEPGRDLVETVLGPHGGGPENAGLRAALLQRTTGILRRRRRMRRLGAVAALLACYLAGAATAETWWPWRPLAPAAAHKEGATVGEPTSVAGTQDSTEPKPGREAPLPEGAGPPPATAKVSPFEVRRRAGDRFLREPAQLALAVRSYTNALRVASVEERAISPERDSWLLMALKESRLKERNHGNLDH